MSVCSWSRHRNYDFFAAHKSSVEHDPTSSPSSSRSSRGTLAAGSSQRAVTGYRSGAITPFGSATALPVIAYVAAQMVDVTGPTEPAVHARLHAPTEIVW